MLWLGLGLALGLGSGLGLGFDLSSPIVRELVLSLTRLSLCCLSMRSKKQEGSGYEIGSSVK